MSKPALHYFQFSARGEVPRLILEEAGVDYEYVTHIYGNWADGKAKLNAEGKLAFGQLPLYTESDLSVVQSGAIARHLARKHGLNGANDLEATHIDVAYEGIADFYNVFIKYNFGTDEASKPAAKGPLLKETVPTQLAHFEAILKKNGSNGFLVGSKLSYADLALLHTLQSFTGSVGADFTAVVENFPLVKAHLHSVSERPNIKAYYGRNVYKQ